MATPRRCPDHVGRPAFKVTPAVIARVEELAAQAMPKGFIARALGISHATLNRKEKEFVEFEEAFEKGKTKLLQRLTAGMVVNALTPTSNAPGGMWAAQTGLYDRIVGKQDNEAGQEIDRVIFERVRPVIRAPGE